MSHPAHCGLVPELVSLGHLQSSESRTEGKMFGFICLDCTAAFTCQLLEDMDCVLFTVEFLPPRVSSAL